MIYGRRRIGKTECLLNFCSKKPHIYFLATEKTYNENIGDLQNSIGGFLNEKLLQNAAILDFEALISVFLERKKPEKVIIVLDEFQILIQLYRPILSTLQRIWDVKISRGNDVMVILCGSSIGMMETEVLDVKSPLYGRRTGQWKFDTLKFADLSGFFPTHTLEDRIKFYGVSGGVPGYLTRLDANLSFEENLLANIFSKGSYLYEEAEILLRQEFREPARYFSILRAIAAGKNHFGEIVNETNLDAATVSKYLSYLQQLRIVERVLPILSSIKDKIRPKKGQYLISDQYISFWFKFVFPYKAILESRRTKDHYDMIEIGLQQYFGEVFEELCRKELGHLLIEENLVEIGSWWKKGIEIDVVAKGKILYLLEIKWSVLNTKEADDVIQMLIEKGRGIEGEKKYGLIAKKVEEKRVLRKNGYLVWDLEDIQEKLTAGGA